MPLSSDSPGLRPAPLADTFYYLRNFQSVLRWCHRHHSDLLCEQERDQLDTLLALPQAAQALLARLTMRKGPLFRSDGLNYPEIGAANPPLNKLSAAGLATLDPPASLAQLSDLCRRPELAQLVERHCPHWPGAALASKAALASQLQQALGDATPRTLSSLWPTPPFTVIALDCNSLLERIQLMFFGNLRQDWREFVLAELGHQRYEHVAFQPGARAFQTRAEVDFYLALHRCHQTLEQHDPEQDDPTPPPASDNPWLEHRRQRLLFTLGQRAERAGRIDQAQALYRQCQLGGAWVRYFRMLEKRHSATDLLSELATVAVRFPEPEVQLHFHRIEQRLARRAGLTLTAPTTPAKVRQRVLELPRRTDQSVEMAVQSALNTDQTPTYYVENHLFPGLLGLLLWPVLFGPLPGAFFHPFQAGPADLFRQDFVSRREAAIAKQLASLQDGSYKQRILDTYRAKLGLSCRLVFWPALSEQLISQALDCIEPTRLGAIFNHLLVDLRNHCRGLPDLIRFDLAARDVELIEVKGPGDRLQDHQRLWMTVFQQLGITASVVQVRWQDYQPGSPTT